MKPHLLIASIAFCCIFLLAPERLCAQTGGIINTKHNLSASGPGTIKVVGETEICKFCHTPHAASPIAPLWNRADPGTYYETYKSKTLQATVGQPTGSSRLCLSCHDGTIALTEVFNKSRPIAGTIFISSGDAGYIGTELDDDHPISFVYDAALAAKNRKLHNPSGLPSDLPLDAQNQLQCTTCHDPHSNGFGQFLRSDNRGSQLCLSCHNVKDWMSSSHATSSSSVGGAVRDRWDNVSFQSVNDLACESCHRPHNAGGRERLMRHEAEEDNCLSCHDGSVTSKNIAGELQKFSVHPVDLANGVHDPTEDPRTMQKHVECSDCHDPHRVSGIGSDIVPFIKASMKGASGLSSLGVPIPEATYEYEVCYKCHATRDPVREPLVDRVIRNNSMADKFAISNLSYHPVEAIGKSTDVPSLLQPLTTTTRMYCTDCHGSNNQTTLGPHGSSHTPLLLNNYDFSNPEQTVESPTAYALCYRCHNRNVILENGALRKVHKKHIKDKKTTCSVCHDPHGVQDSTHLINFDREVVFPSQKASGDKRPRFEDLGLRRGSCTLRCHNKDHDDKDYGD